MVVWTIMNLNVIFEYDRYFELKVRKLHLMHELDLINKCVILKINSHKIFNMQNSTKTFNLCYLCGLVAALSTNLPNLMFSYLKMNSQQ